MNSVLIMCVGFLAQGFFSARILVQWIMSERARHVLSPTVFWILSLAGSYLLCLYGWLRDDFSIVLGQFIAYYIYLWNLNAKGVWQEIPAVLRLILMFTPVVALGFMVRDFNAFVGQFFENPDVPIGLLVYGSAGQVIFTLRFVYQWFYSQRIGVSKLPAGFWILSLVGSLTIVSYAVVRHDWVLIVGQSFGLVSYTRNLMILAKYGSK